MEIGLRKKTYEELQQTLCECILKSRAYEKALDKACAILEEGYGEEYASYEYFPDADTMEKIPMRMDACKWKEWLLND